MLTPIPSAIFDRYEYHNPRPEFGTDERLDLMLRSMQCESAAMVRTDGFLLPYRELLEATADKLERLLFGA